MGCAASRQVKLINQSYIDECGYSDQALSPIKDKVVFLYTGVEQTPEMFNNQSYASALEKPVIAIWIKKRNDCNKREQNILLLRNKQVVDDLITLLYQGKITYGEFATYRDHVIRLALDIEAVEAAIAKHAGPICK